MSDKWRLVYADKLFWCVNDNTGVRIPEDKVAAMIQCLYEQIRDDKELIDFLLSCNLITKEKTKKAYEKYRSDYSFSFEAIDEGKWQNSLSFSDILQADVREVQLADYTFPRSGMILISPECDMKCRYCYWKKEQNGFLRKNDLDIEDWKKVISECAANGIHTLIFMGGEPMKYKGILELLKQATENHIYCKVTTKHLFSEEERSRLGEMDKKYLEICLSIDTTNNDISELLFESAKWGQALLLNLRQLTKEGIKVSVQPVVLRQTISDYPGFIDEMLEAGASSVIINRYKGNDSLLEVKDWEWNNLVQWIREQNNKSVSLMNGSDHGECINGEKAFVMLWNGDVIRCEHMPESLNGNYMGSVCEKSLAEIWKKRESRNHGLCKKCRE